MALGQVDTSPRGTISPKTTQRVILSHTSSHSIQNTTHNGNANDIVHNDRIFHSKAQTNANQVDRIVNNGKIDNCLNGKSVITATKATSTIDVVDANLIHANKSVEALAVIVQYLANDLHAFSTPSLKKANENSIQQLMETQLQLENVRINCTKLESQLAEKDEFYQSREKDLHDQYQSEISKLESRLAELGLTSNGRVASLQNEIASKEKEWQEKFENVTRQLKEQICVKDDQLAIGKKNEEEFLQRIKSLSSTQNELREKVLASETEFGERIQLAALRERESNDKLKDLTEKLALAQNEVLVLRGVSNGAANSPPKVVHHQPMVLENEIQSWRSVLEMKQKEISDLQKQNHELKNAAASLPGALTKISALEARLEDLTIQLQNKNDGEQDLLQKNKQLEQTVLLEVKSRKHSNLENEQLKYKIKSNIEKISALLDIVNNRNESSYLSDSAFILNGSEYGNDTSPPATPVVKGVIEKNASVSYILEMNDEESTEAFVSRVVRRAGSFRQQRNSLSQSASATSILRQHSETPGTPRSSYKNTRMRSKSVSTNSSDVLDEKAPQSNKREKPIWSTPLSSTPNSKLSMQTNDNDLQLSEESETESPSRPQADKGQYFRRSNSYKHTKRGLITCNTAALTSQRPDLCLSLPVHPTVKELKKCQQIKESAGEAMVSGTNSEDEASSASSDGSLSSRSSSSGRRRSSIEDANIDKIVASLDIDGAGNAASVGLAGTPMEVSWSEDVDHFASESAV
ncbi:hypothetical protein Bhyg_05192 [Pseudolycoriella hygida]|uniref:Uncharacterized protein n=1 Tax=Pseudolycoriella hygida TaxID=35572 RepID=A0A9Q0NGN5_9DIPT|nr:hypothetical protein Bhyg_05192 [Pseudolycoriella hygida]